MDEFSYLCKSTILQESLQFAFITTKSPFRITCSNYNKKVKMFLAHSREYDARMVMKYSKPRADVESLDIQSLSCMPDCVKKDFSSFIGQMNEKYTYVGIVQGLFKNNTDIEVMKNLCQEMRQSSTKKKQKPLKEAQ